MKKISIAFSLMINFIMSVILATVTGFNVVAIVSVIFALQLLPIGAIGFGAKIILTDFIGDIWGKVGATVYKKNFYGLSRIMKANPKNPKTESQMQNRGKFGDLYSIFLNLSQNAYLAWKQLAQSTPFVKKGRAYFLDVLPFFCKVNRNLELIGEAPITIAPDFSESPQVFESWSVDYVVTPGSEDIVLNISPAIDVTDKVKLYATPAVGARQNSIANKMRFIGYVDSGTFTSGDSIKDKWEAVFGPMGLLAGKKYYFAIQPVVKATGKDGMKQQQLTVSAA